TDERRQDEPICIRSARCTVETGRTREFGSGGTHRRRCHAREGMSMKRFIRSFKSICMALAPLLTVAGCGGSDDSSTMSGAPMAPTMVSQAITARSGGSVSFPGGAVTAMIPADALNQDTMVTIERVNGQTAAVSAPLSANGDIYTVSLGSGA